MKRGRKAHRPHRELNPGGPVATAVEWGGFDVTWDVHQLVLDDVRMRMHPMIRLDRVLLVGDDEVHTSVVRRVRRPFPRP